MRRVIAAVLALLLAPNAFAAPAADSTARPAVHAAHATSAIRVDAVLDEDVWKSAVPVTEFRQNDPDQGAPPRERSEVRVAYDEQALYVGARLYDDAPDSIRAQLARRDNGTAADAFQVYLDPLCDRTTGYYFAVSAAGTLLDGVLYNDSWNDDSWDGVWSARARRDSLGWTAEMRIPFSQLRFRSGADVRWGINFRRFLSRSNEADMLVYTPRGQSGFVSRFADLEGLGDPRSGRHVEISPYATSKGEFLVHDAADPFNDGSRLSSSAGGDLRASVSSRLKLNATVNPDFGQVEIDPAVVNLTDVETFFQEKRPFFTEGVSMFRCGNNGANDYWGFNWADPTFFYARRIGRAPEGRVPRTADYADVPLAARILGAAKLTGQLAPGWSFASLHALTRREEADFTQAGVPSRIGVEPLTYYGVVRGQHEMNDRRQGLGLLAQTSIRQFEPGESLRDQVNASGTAITMDGWSFLDHTRTWVLSGWSGISNVTGSRARITALQRSSPHYYQRPDASYLGVDSSATSLNGAGARLWLNKQSGRFLSNSAIGFLSPGLELNDMGFQTRTDVINFHAGAGWQWNDPNRWRQYANVISALAGSWDFGGVNTFRGLYVGGYLQQRNQWEWNGSSFFLLPVLSDRKTRGGPLMSVAGREVCSFGVNSNPQHRLSWSVSSNPNFTHDGSYEWTLNPSVKWRPAPNVSFTVGPNVDRVHTTTQYVTTKADPAATATYGAHYVFAKLDQTTVSADLRMDVQMTPALGLQVYAQPLVSSADFHDFGELARPRSDEILYYDPANLPGFVPAPDFTFRTLRANTVLRWEYRPGSTVYVVWTQDRSGQAGDGSFNLDESLADIAHTQASDIFLVKLTHHFDL
jgi:hypothetical protein